MITKLFERRGEAMNFEASLFCQGVPHVMPKRNAVTKLWEVKYSARFPCQAESTQDNSD